jgi:hypothetical protein
MAYVESAVVVYLRAIYYPHGFGFPLAQMAPRVLAIEIGREAATLIMLLGVAAVAGADRWEWFLAFCLGFGVWDIFYYVWLWMFVRWPPSPFTWDVLFLIPVPWTGPVLAPVLVSGALVAGSLLMLRLKAQGVKLGFSKSVWMLAVTGGLLVVGSFVLDSASVLRSAFPPPFHWGVFAIGVGLGMTALLMGISRLDGVLPGGAHNLGAGEPGVLQALLRFASVCAGRERSGDHLLPAIRDTPVGRQSERRDAGGHGCGASVGPKGGDHNVESLGG